MFKSMLLQLSIGFQLLLGKKEVTSEEFPELVA
jgi:hypothetical protein